MHGIGQGTFVIYNILNSKEAETILGMVLNGGGGDDIR